MASAEVLPFSISVSDSTLVDLRNRLNLARFPQNVELSAETEWSYGTPTQHVQNLVDYWKTSFDWRNVEANINAKLPQFTTQIDAGDPHGVLTLHFVHKRSPIPKAIPLLFSHGWPGSFLEVMKIIEPLTNPSDPKDPAFHVVAPSLPGYAFSEASKVPGLALKTTALMFDKLMKKLGYNHYIAQGGDWGAMIVKALALDYSSSCRGTHSNLPLVSPPTILRNPIQLLRAVLGFMGLPGGYSKRDIANLKDGQEFDKSEMGYARIHSTKPQTVAYGLTDSPTALLAWMYEKLHKWTDEYPWTPDEILTWVMLYWISNAGPVGSVRYYKEAKIDDPNGELSELARAYSNVPLGVSIFSKELFKFPADWYNMIQPLVYHKYHESGGHFAAYEKPEQLVNDICRFAEIIIKRDKSLLPVPT